jgi:chemotaxis protein MotA
MDLLSIVGAVLAIAALLVGSILKGAGLSALWSPAAFTIVFIGTFAAILLQTPMQTFKHSMKIAGWVFKPPKNSAEELIAKITAWSNTARKQGLLGLEGEVEAQTDPFLKKGLQLLVDGSEPDAIRSALEIDLSTREHGDIAAAKVFEGMGIYSPTLGIIGAVLGLIAVMKNLADPSKLGHGIAAAFTATIYGIGLANLFLLPMAGKLKGIIAANSRMREMAIEGLIAIGQGENPRNIEARLQGYLH